MKKNELSEIELLRKKLEEKILNIEKKKLESKPEIKKEVEKEEKSLFELRKEMEALQKAKKNKINATVLKNNEENIKENTIINELTKSSKEKNTNAKVSETNKLDSNQIEFKKEVTTQLKLNVVSELENDTLKKAPLKKKNQNKTKESFIKNKTKVVVKKKKKQGIANHHIIIFIAIFFAVIYIGYLFKLKIDLNKEKALLEMKKQEAIDYNKNDAVFKDVEEDEKPIELQQIK